MAQDKKLQKLELTWIGKDDSRELIEPRILIENPDYSYGTVETGTLPNGKSWNGNMLIHGDNLLALKALEQNYTGAVKCIYIDPPFNTGARINADGQEIGYDDGIEHSIWLNMMYERFAILYNLLRDDGAIFVHLDDNEADYCKVILDEIFHRENFMNRITIDARSPSAFSTVNPGMFVASEYILCLTTITTCACGSRRFRNLTGCITSPNTRPNATNGSGSGSDATSSAFRIRVIWII